MQFERGETYLFERRENVGLITFGALWLASLVGVIAYGFMVH
jgi:hypothetical protein